MSNRELDIFDKNIDKVNKLEDLYTSEAGTFSKTIKLLQYCSVITSEYGLYHKHFRGMGIPPILEGIFGGELLNADQAEVMRLKWKKLGSAFSTARMTIRFADCIFDIQYVINKFRDAFRGKLKVKDESFLDWAIAILDIIGGISDNWVFLNRIKVMEYKKKW